MKVTITKKDLRDMIFNYSGVDIENTRVEIELEGYVKAKDYRLVAKLPEPKPDLFGATIKTDSSMNVLDISNENALNNSRHAKKVAYSPRETKHIKPAVRKDDKRRTQGILNLKNRVDYTEYEREVLDFVTSSEATKKLPLFEGTLEANKERYKKTIKKQKAGDMVKLVVIDKIPYLKKIES